MSTIFGYFLAASLVYTVAGICPHQDNSLHLKPWSQPNTWPSGKPTVHASVQISDHVLLDEQPPELNNITITASGRLVWSPDVNITLKVKYIYISGRLDIGSESCPFTSPARIILTGRRGEFQFRDHMGMKVGDKFVLVANGGTLEIHGKPKLSWTKLTSTVPILTKTNGIIFDHLESGNALQEKYENGIIAYVFTVDSHNHVTVKSHGSFELLSTWQRQQEQTRFISMIKNVTGGDILALGIHYNLFVGNGSIDSICDAFETLVYGHVTRTSVLRTVRHHDAYTAVVHKRNDGQVKFTENIDRFHSDGDTMLAKSAYLPPNTSVKVSVESYVDQKRSWLSVFNVRISTLDGAYPKLNLVDDVSTWQQGDRVVLTSTDYDWTQAEEATVVHCSDCASNQIRIDLEVKYEHWGRIENRVDERGEVALLSRNIVIEGEVEDRCVTINGNCNIYTEDTYGGQLKFLQGSTVHIEGVELYHMGQQTDVGRYPLHFHMGFDMRNMSSPPYLRDNSIHHCFSRCISIHGTHGVLVMDNVCYDTLGHAYFVEDGGEHDTVFDGNLAASVKPGHVIPSDVKTPAAFWITSPLTRMRNNVAAGGEGHGIWYIFPVEPIGPSRGLGFFQPHEADRTPILEFDNNVAHSHRLSGLFFDNRLMPDGSASQNDAYFPKENPSDEKSKDVEVKFYRLTAYKNGIQNAWLRGGWFHIIESSFADSQKSLTFARTSNQNQFVSNSVMIGLSSNLGKPEVNWTRSLPVWYDIHAPIQGLVFYDGPMYAENIWFDGFVPTKLYTAGALGYNRLNVFSSSAVNGVRNAQFGFADGVTTGNRVFDGDEGMHGYARYDGDKVATNRDYDGSVSGKTMAHLVKPWPYYVTADCTYRQNWGMAICPHIYGKLRLTFDRKYRNQTWPIMVRDDLPTINETLDALESADFLVILGGSKTYTLHWKSFIPAELTIYGDGLERGNQVRFGVCLPLGSSFDLYSYSPRYLPDKAHWTAATSLHELDLTMNGTKYFYDTKTGMVYFNFVCEQVRHANETNSCPGRCPMVTIKNIQGNLHDADCRSRLYHSTRSDDNRAITIPHDTRQLGATMNQPPTNWGAGRTKPFLNRVSVNGGLGKWTNWSSCSLSCGGGHQERTRMCDSPRPANGGQSCHGSLKEQQACNTQTCHAVSGASLVG